MCGGICCLTSEMGVSHPNPSVLVIYVPFPALLVLGRWCKMHSAEAGRALGRHQVIAPSQVK